MIERIKQNLRALPEMLKKNRIWRFAAVCLLILVGIAVVRSGLNRSITVIIDGEEKTIQTSALTVGGALRSAGFSVQKEDRVVPTRGQWLWRESLIQIATAREIWLVTPEEEFSITTPEHIPANILSEAGITLYPQDGVIVNGERVDPQSILENVGSFLIQYVPAVSIQVLIDGNSQTIYSSQPTLGAALDESSITLAPKDHISHSLLAPPTESMMVTIRRARPVTVRVGDAVVTGATAAITVGDALQDIGISLQYLDYSLPADDAPIPETSEIEVVRVDEDLLIETDEVAHSNEYVEDPETVLDQVSVVEPGQVGIFASRERIRYVNGEEALRMDEGSWQASEPKDGELGYGTRVEIRTEVVDGITIEYWRKKTVYANSYKPCDNQGVCHDGTAGGYPLQKGIIAVTPQWYSVPNGLAMADLPVYVPGYGHAIIGDVGGGIPGRPWIDLAFRDENYESWHHWTTLYFLTPVPAYYPAIITP